MVGTVGKISALRPEGPRFDLSSDEVFIFVQPSFPPKLTQFTILSGWVNEYQRLLGANLRWISAPSRGSQRLSST